MYSPQVLDHFEHPRHTGELDHPDASAQVENPACGDVLKLTLRISQNQITEARFQAKGCVPAMACGSLITELMEGKNIAHAQNMTAQDLIAAAGGLPPASGHAAQLAIETLRKALSSIR
jgi:nitrogen fixation protein NifU and related proteins